LDAAHATQNEPTRAALLRLAADWQRMAEGWDGPQPNTQPTAQQQQQQQVQPKNGRKE
jgi:hypothetical protein